MINEIMESILKADSEVGEAIIKEMARQRRNSYGDKRTVPSV